MKLPVATKLDCLTIIVIQVATPVAQKLTKFERRGAIQTVDYLSINASLKIECQL